MHPILETFHSLVQVLPTAGSLATAHPPAALLYAAPPALCQLADRLIADPLIDSSLLSLYIHQNYTPFCTEVEECSGVAEWLTWVDSSGGEAWYQANPHRFHLLMMGTLHSLPSPVPRRGQKLFKPQFFNYLMKEKDAWDTVRDENEGWRLGGWSRTEVAPGLGGMLKYQAVYSHYQQPSAYQTSYQHQQHVLPAPQQQQHQQSVNMAWQAITNSQQANAGAFSTADIAMLNDAIGSASVDLRAEEESLQHSHQTPSYSGTFEDRSRKQPLCPAF
ncbi:hypothetical protein B0H14DRAFT_3641061 [Mycena olivaceomarginata]|nr:hypothetical protein B0H14DRAFT_3641061 [Mycena olivaceomarginata]